MCCPFPHSPDHQLLAYFFRFFGVGTVEKSLGVHPGGQDEADGNVSVESVDPEEEEEAEVVKRFQELVMSTGPKDPSESSSPRPKSSPVLLSAEELNQKRAHLLEEQEKLHERVMRLKAVFADAG